METRGCGAYSTCSQGCASEITDTRERMGLGRLNEEVRDACSRDYVYKAIGIPSAAGSNVLCVCSACPESYR